MRKQRFNRDSVTDMMSEFLLTVCDGPDTTLAHLTMRLAGLARARSIIRAFHEYLTQDHVLRASMIYLLPYSTDLDTIKELVATDTATEMRRVTTRGVGQKMIFFDTYDSWMASGGKLGDSPLRVVAMDLGCDQEYAGAALALNLALREAGRGGQGGNKKTCILSLSASGRSPFDPQLTGRHLPGLTPRREVVAHDPAGVEHDTASKDWRRRAAEEIQQAGAASQAPNYDGPCAIVCFMSEADFRMLSAVLRDRVRDGVRTVAVKPWVPGEPLGFLGRVPEDSKPKIRLVHVGHDANFLPQILNLKGVIVGPTVDDFVFDSVISCVVEAEAPLPGRALRLAEAVAQCAEDEDNFFIRHYAMQEPGRTPLAPSVERDLLYLVVGLVRDGPPTSPEDLPVRLPRGDVDCVSMLREATRRLRLWGLITTRAGQRQLQPTEPLGRRAAECMRHETNINAAVLLGCVEAGMPSRTAKAMIQLAMLISHGPTDIYRHGRQDARTHEAALRQAGFPRDLCGRGGLWLALGWLRALESLESPVTEGPPGTLIRANAKIVVAMSVRDRAQEWMRRLSVGGDGDDDGQLTREDVLAIDKALVRCFFFNCMSLDEAGERRQQYARDITSQVILQPRDGVTDEAIDWARTTTDAGPALFGVYTHLKRTTRPDGRYEYTPMNPTAIPFEAMSDVMAEVCPEGLDRMRPSQGIPSWYKEFRNDKDVVVPGKGEHDKGVQQATTTAAGAGAVLGVEQLTLAKNVYEAGQICMSTERILVHSSVAAAFQSLLRQATSRIFEGPAKTPMVITAGSAKRNRALVAQAQSKGAEVLHGGSDAPLVNGIETVMPPVILTKMTREMDLYGGESFGPSVSLFTFDTEDEAIELANNTPYGLSAAVFTEDLRLALRVADRLESGAIHINSMTVHDEFALPHGGIKNSGFGRFNGYHGLDEFLYFKTVTWME